MKKKKIGYECITAEIKKIDCEYMTDKEKKVERCKVEYEEIIEENLECEFIEDNNVDYYEKIKKLLLAEVKKE